jgi:hypothetical protein
MAPSRSRCRKQVHRGDAPDLLSVAGAALLGSATSTNDGCFDAMVNGWRSCYAWRNCVRA